nr:MAG TPA: hypothetical protein [Caudoviricetes sp.]
MKYLYFNYYIYIKNYVMSVFWSVIEKYQQKF